MRNIGHFIGGKEVAGTSRAAPRDVFQPMTGEVIGQGGARLARPSCAPAVENAKAAQPAWAATNPQRRARVMMKFLDLIAQRHGRARRPPRPRARQDHRRTPRATSSAASRWWSSPAASRI